MFVVNLVIYFVMMPATVLRVILYPKSTLKQSANANEAAYWACLPIASLTIIAQIALTPSQANWNGTGHAFTLLAYVLWWICVAWIVTLATAAPAFLARQSETKDENMTTAVFIPAVGVATQAVVGANIVTYAYGVSPQLAVPVIIVGYLLVGLGLNLALIMYALFLNRLMASGWPQPAQIPALIVLVGPMGQSAAGIVFLGQAASMNFGGYNEGTFLTMMSGMSASAASVVIALLLLGFDVLWILLSVYGILEAAFKGKLFFTLSWWATIFPMGQSPVPGSYLS
ncbi:MAG: hypothetical protein LQ340_002981 [Diploschistes diacapsis]|nr:MAG: hypothetical protein LQ340_002981 [Diploschistes diacapsis]